MEQRTHAYMLAQSAIADLKAAIHETLAAAPEPNDATNPLRDKPSFEEAETSTRAKVTGKVIACSGQMFLQVRH